jgi:hypothetical protein
METLFDTYSGRSTSNSTTTLTDNLADWKVNEYQEWYVDIQSVGEVKILSNTSDTLTFESVDPFISPAYYDISLVGREYLKKIESDASDTTKITTDLIDKKYEQTNIDLSNKVVAYLKKLYTKEFDPTKYIFNQLVLQRPYAYYMLFLIYSDLSIHRNSRDEYKKEDYFNQYSYLVNDALALLKVDYNKDGVEDTNEIQQSASTMIYGAR